MQVLSREVKPADTVELDLWIGPDGSVTKAILLKPKLAPEAERAVLSAAEKMKFAETNVRGQRFVVAFSRAEIENAASDSGIKPPPVPTHMKERVPRPEMAPKPPPPRPEMAPRPPKDKPGSGF